MIFAQGSASAPTPAGTWVIVSGMVTMILGFIAKWAADARKDRNDKDARERDLVTNIEIRDALRQIEVGTEKQNGKLDVVVRVDQAHHEELIRVLQTNCKAQPILVQQVNQEKDKQTKD